jgi:hypothetical protein
VQKFFIIAAFILLSSVAASAQTEQKAQAESRQVPQIAKLPEVVGEKQPTAASSEAQTNGKSQTARVVDGRVVRVGPTTTYLKKGLTKDEVVRLLGKPTIINERQDGSVLRSTYIFERSEGRRLVAEFENGMLTRSNVEAIEDEAASGK